MAYSAYDAFESVSEVVNHDSLGGYTSMAELQLDAIHLEPARDDFAATKDIQQPSQAVESAYTWSNQFREALNMPCSSPADRLARARALQATVTSFNKHCATLGSQIVSEMHLPIQDRVIKPADIGGVAGGEKFLAGALVWARRAELLHRTHIVGQGSPHYHKKNCFLFAGEYVQTGSYSSLHATFTACTVATRALAKPRTTSSGVYDNCYKQVKMDLSFL